MLTHTSPCPPRDAGLALVAAAVVARVAGAGLAATGGLVAVSVLAFLRPRFSTGEAEAAAVLSAAAGEATAVASAFFCARRFPGDGDAAGDSAGEGDAASSAGEAVASAFLCARCFSGDGDAAGDSAVEGDGASSAGEAAASAFLCARCFVDEGDASGVPPGTSN